MTLQEYLTSLRHKTVAVIGIGVSNTPLLELLLAEGIRVTACDKRSREQMGEQAEHLEQLGCELHLGADYLKDLDADVIFRTPGLRPDVPELAAAVARGSALTSEMEVFTRRIEGILTARTFMILDYNCPTDKLEALTEITPGLSSPTVSPLENKEWVAVRAMVPRKEANAIMDRLSAGGAEAILASDISIARL